MSQPQRILINPFPSESLQRRQASEPGGDYSHFLRKLPEGAFMEMGDSRGWEGNECGYGDDAIPNMTGYCLQAENIQVAFNENALPLVTKPHRHAASWGVVLAGSVELTINHDPDAGELWGPHTVVTTHHAGHLYSIPAGCWHTVAQSENYRDVVFFDGPKRLTPRQRDCDCRSRCWCEPTEHEARYTDPSESFRLLPLSTENTE